MKKTSHIETLAIHAGQVPDSATGAVIMQINQTSTYVQDNVGITKGFDYNRTANTTLLALEECLTALESPGQHKLAFGLAFSSGTTLLSNQSRYR